MDRGVSARTTGPIMSSTLQPMAKYSANERRGHLPMARSLYIVPESTSTHCTAKAVQPIQPPTTPMQMGDYEQAIMTYMLMWSHLRNACFTAPSGAQWYNVLDRNIRNIPNTKNATPSAICHPICAEGQTSQMEERANAAPNRCVHVFALSRAKGRKSLFFIANNGIQLFLACSIVSFTKSANCW